MIGYLTEISPGGVFQNAQGIPIKTPDLNDAPSSLAPTVSGGFVFLSDTDLYLARLFATPSVRPLLSGPGWSESQSFQFWADGETNVNYRVEISTDLRQWSVLTNYAAGDSRHRFTDPLAGKTGQRFYRTVAE